jgi:hypothetical protein
MRIKFILPKVSYKSGTEAFPMTFRSVRGELSELPLNHYLHISIVELTFTWIEIKTVLLIRNTISDSLRVLLGRTDSKT